MSVDRVSGLNSFFPGKKQKLMLSFHFYAKKSLAKYKMTVMTLLMTMTVICIPIRAANDFAMSRLLGAMKLKIREIVVIEQRPVCFLDLMKFDINGQTYEMDHGTFRNNISKLRRAGEIEEAFRSKPMFYTIPGKKFSKSMTQDHTDKLLSTNGSKTVLLKNRHFTI
jgi:hypothetical protein